MSGRLVKWAVELGEYGLQYRPRAAIEGQTLADFIVECRFEEVVTEDLSPNPKLADPGSPGHIFSQDWRLYVDGSFTQKGSGAGILLICLEGQVYQYGLMFGFLATNNVAKYEAVIVGLGLAEALKVYPLQVHSDSQLIVGAMLGNI